VVVLHDLSVVHLVFNNLLAVEDDYFVATMQRWYGTGGRRAALEGLEHRGEWAWRPETVQQFPLTEVALESATSVVTHSRYAADALVNRYVGDVTVLPLPIEQHFDDGDQAAVDLALPDDRLVILQAGVLNPNKHIAVVLEAVVEADLAEEVHLVICGHAQARELQEVRRQIDKLGLRASTTVLGEVSDATLDALRRRADIATVLRHPCGEAASGVLAETLGYGIAVVSVDDGCYREAPDEAVLRVPVPPDAADVGAALRRWVDHPELRVAASEHGKAFVREQHSPEAYARGMLAALRRTGSARRRVALARDLSSIAARAGFGPESSLVDRLAERAHELFAPAPHRLPSAIPPGEQVE
jgi:glycosyltransferase involved in cell wall biosynthesis